MIEIKCSNCKTGKIVAEYIKLRDNKEISTLEFLSRAKQTGTHCVMCIHNKVGKRKAKLYKKLYKNFQVIDLYDGD
jgi:hypothetical protein